MPVTESEKILYRIRGLLEGKTVIDLGCGRKPIVPWAHGVDDMSESKIVEPGTAIAKVDPVGRQVGDSNWDVVFSSHTLEHIQSTILTTLRYWLSMVRQGGNLILYLPDERRYVFDPKNPKVKNPEHHHYLTPDTFRWYLDQLPVIVDVFEEDPVEFDRYSFLVVARKK